MQVLIAPGPIHEMHESPSGAWWPGLLYIFLYRVDPSTEYIIKVGPVPAFPSVTSPTTFRRQMPNATKPFFVSLVGRPDNLFAR